MNLMTATTGTLWNGPICPTCCARYLGTHVCTQADLIRRINELLALLGTVPATNQAADPTRNCPCRPENGGSGVCGCVLGGPTVTCSAASA